MTSSERSNVGGYAFTLCGVGEHNKAATKTITRRPDGVLDKTDYDDVFRWAFRVEERAGHAEMAAFLRSVAKRADRMIVMGAIAPGVDLGVTHRRLWARPNPAENTLVGALRWWLPLDVDGTTVPRGLGRPERFLDGAAWVRDNVLPDAFRGIECVAAASASSGMMGDNVWRGRLFFLLDQPHEVADLRRWSRGAQVSKFPLDASVVQLGQPIYVNRPRWVGMDDPLAPELWAAVIPGVLDDSVALDVTEFDLALFHTEQRAEAAIRKAVEDGGGWRSFVFAELGRDLGFFEPLSRAIGAAARTDEDENDITDTLLGLLAVRADPGRKVAYDRAWVISGIRRFRARDRAGAARLAAAIRNFPISEIDNV